MLEKRQASLRLLQAALTIASTRPLACGCADAYQKSVDTAVGSALEFASSLLSDLAKLSDPHEEIGPEPRNHSEAVAWVSSFLKLCCDQFARSGDLPFMCMATRAQTFACLLAAPNDEN